MYGYGYGYPNYGYPNMGCCDNNNFGWIWAIIIVIFIIFFLNKCSILSFILDGIDATW